MSNAVTSSGRLAALHQGLDSQDDSSTDLIDQNALSQQLANDGWSPDLPSLNLLGPITLLPTTASTTTDATAPSSDTPAITNSGGSGVGDTGDAAMNAPAARAAFNIDGTGLRIGIISDSFDAGSLNLSAVQAEEADGDLPSTVTVLSDLSSGTDEGRAMAELVHKVAPGAQIYFATEGSGQSNMASAIASLEAAGCNLIVDDVSFFAEPFFQDGSVIQTAVETATGSGVSYFTSAGNQYSHDYQSTIGALATQHITINATGNIDIDMQWTQPFKSIGANSSGSAYSIGWELFVAGTTINPVAESITNDTSGDPVQNFQTSLATGTYDLVFVQQGSVTPTATDTVKVVVITQDWFDVTMAVGTGSGTTFGHELVSSANVVGAVNANAPQSLEPYSADGPGEIFYNSSGTALVTPIVESTPNFLAPDDITTSVVGFSTFAGTSAAAPDATAAGALLLQINPNLTPAELQTVLTQTASTTGLSGAADQEGAGLINVQASATLVYDGEVAINGTTVYNGTSAEHDSVLAWNGGSGDWTSTAEWTGSVAPEATSYVTLGDNLGALGSSYAVTLNSAAGTVATLTVGDAASIATALTLAAGGSLGVAGGATVGKAGSVTVETGASLGVAGLLRLDDITDSTAQLVLGTGAQLAADGFDITGGSVTIGTGASLTDTGSLAIAQGGAGTVALAGTALVGGGITLGALGLLTLGIGAEMSATGTLIGQSTGTLSSSVIINRTDTLSALSLSGGHVTIDTGGTLEISAIPTPTDPLNLFSTKIDAAPGSGSDGMAHIVFSGVTHAATDAVRYSPGSGFLSVQDVVSGATTSLAFLGLGTLNHYTASSFSIDDDGSGPLEVNIACYVSGTRIATAAGEVPVERLRTGDQVLAASGELKKIRWIGRRGYSAAAIAAERKLRPIRVAAGALGDRLPRRDLFVSQQHALLLDGVLVPAVQLVNGATITRCDAADAVAYFHIELAEHSVILAEGQPAESFVDRNSRAEFANAADFFQFYPDALPTIMPFCAPRVEGGPVLARIRATIEARAGVRPGPLQGNLDRADSRMVEGWAFDPANPWCPVLLEIVVDGAVAGVLMANQHRSDLRAMNGGNCAFYFPDPPEGDVLVRRAADHALIGASGFKPRSAKTGSC